MQINWLPTKMSLIFLQESCMNFYLVFQRMNVLYFFFNLAAAAEIGNFEKP